MSQTKLSKTVFPTRPTLSNQVPNPTNLTEKNSRGRTNWTRPVAPAKLTLPSRDPDRTTLTHPIPDRTNKDNEVHRNKRNCNTLTHQAIWIWDFILAPVLGPESGPQFRPNRVSTDSWWTPGLWKFGSRNLAPKLVPQNTTKTQTVR